MVTIDVSTEDMSRLMGLDKPISAKELDDYVSFAISEVETEPEGPDEKGHTKVSIAIKSSNRPDLWCAEGISRVVRGRLDQPGLPELETQPSGYEIEIDEGLLGIRPYIGAAVVRGLELDDFLIKQIIQLQEKVDFSFGRRRKKTSIGIYNVNMLESPIKYTLVDRGFKFAPLQFEEELTVDQIFEQHPKGIEYRHILDPFEKVPMLLDENDLVLSMPPIINSNDVGRVTDGTTDVLVEVTGTNYEAVQVALHVTVQALRDRGGKVESVKNNYPENYAITEDVTPSDELVTILVDPEDINTYLGTNFSEEEMIDLLRQRRNEAEKKGGKILVKAPPWRKDILHWVDVSEDVAIAANYNTLEPTKVNVVTAGKLHPSTNDENMVRQVLMGLELTEVMSYSLTNREVLSQMKRDQDWIDKICIEISNPLTKSYSVARPDLLPILLSFESKNTHVEYPHRIFETGECVIRKEDEILTTTNASVVLSGPNETFETIYGILDATLGLLGIKYSLEEINEPHYIEGRQAKIVTNGKNIGQIGEIHPQVITDFGIEVPLVAFEIELSQISSLQCKRMITET